jgi:hypothetical protein
MEKIILKTENTENIALKFKKNLKFHTKCHSTERKHFLTHLLLGEFFTKKLKLFVNKNFFLQKQENVSSLFQ